jgi:hypothetical protein
VATVPKKIFDFSFCLREFVLPNDQFAREPCGLDRGKFLENVEWHAGHSN